MRQAGQPSEDQRGAALLSVLMIVATMTVVAVAALGTLTRSVSLTKAATERSYSVWAVRSADQVGQDMVRDLAAFNPVGLTAQALEAMEPQTLVVEGGTITLTMEDATNCFNLNTLVEDDTGTVSDEALERYRRLLEGIEIDDFTASRLADTLADWLDKDTDERQRGAERRRYSVGDIPHQPSGTMIANLSELNVIEGYTEQVLERLSEFVCAYPTAGQAPLNLNILEPGDAPLLAAIYSPELSLIAARQIINTRPREGWNRMDEVLDLPQINTLSPAVRKDELLALTSRHVGLTSSYISEGQVNTYRTVYEWPLEGNLPQRVWHGTGGINDR